jgi:pyruvate formate lyase activating enzyme
MKIGGIQKCSGIDFPGRLSCVIFVSGCNLRCPYCHNPELITRHPNSVISETWLTEFLEKRKHLLSGVVVSGGEPTLNRNLPEFLKYLRGFGYDVKLDTNGTCPDMLGKCIPWCDYLAMDIKTYPTEYPKYFGVRAKSILRSVLMIQESGKTHEFRTTCAYPMITEHTIKKISEFTGDSDYYLQSVRNFKGIPYEQLTEYGKKYGCGVR